MAAEAAAEAEALAAEGGAEALAAGAAQGARLGAAPQGDGRLPEGRPFGMPRGAGRFFGVRAILGAGRRVPAVGAAAFRSRRLFLPRCLW